MSEQTGGQQAPYRVLARKYRPRDFTDLIGQEPMVRTLTNAFQSGRIAQAWMLTGVRGVGKTTTARILARALNYKTGTVDRPSIELSVPGDHCQAIMEGRHVDVIEMDAASHTGIGDIREIIEQVRYMPSVARYKVFIIDEVHMLSTAAFNGLLKTLEEPPPHVKFIFATTEIRKVPVTVLSRCQRFDLRRVEAEALTRHLARIAELEEVEVEADALAMMARAAEGSVRDSLSILDQAIAHGGGHVTAQAVRSMLGLADNARVIDLFESLMKGDLPAALAELKGQYDAGADPAIVLTELAGFTHLVTRLRFVPNAADDASLSQDERTRGLDFSQNLSVRVLSRTWQMLLKGIQEVQNAARPYAAAEMVLIRIAHAADLPTLDEAIRSLDERTGQSGSAPSSAPAPSGGPGPSASASGTSASAVGSSRAAPQPVSGPAMRLVETRSEPAAQMRPAPQPDPEPVADAVPVRSLEDIVALADQHRDLKIKIGVRNSLRLVSLTPGHLSVSLTPNADRALLTDIAQRLKAWTGRNWMVSLSQEEGGRTLAEIEEETRETLFSDASKDPAVAAILGRFPGAKVIDVRLPAAPEELPGAEGMPVEALPDDDDDDDLL
ncbi:DNA polymerase III subunit gamma/tau [Zhengella mangrovi]|uniref:DNA polymerase III subunit gamma/tau n=1 Tax=Zhengella mangrovi TaxID=1982044 RepID=A0A2G1QV68_9HYPH|nr:DNA polymerase III subunit gamma/tau [Zhengella mangrovi]PHP69098.1 DNA polymerase III subunit gamma/tau [Zhengella mangrovi]